MGAIDVRGASLTKAKDSKGRYHWKGQVRYLDEDGTTWRTKTKHLKGEDGAPIFTDADQVDEDGTRTQTTRNIRKAQAALERWRDELAGSVYDRDATVEDYVRADLKGHGNVLAGSTSRGYREYVGIIARGLEGVTIAELDQKRVRLWVRGMVARGLAPSTIRKAYGLLSQVCDRATENGDMAANPCTSKIRRDEIPTSPTEEPNALDAEAVARVNALLDSAKNPRLRIGARLALTCGLREGEVCGLRWRDVDTSAIRVRENVAYVGEKTETKTPKSMAGRRDVPSTVALNAELAEWRAVQLAEWKKLSKGQEDKVTPFEDCRVIGYADGRWFTPNALGRLWRKLARGTHERDEKDRRRRGEGWIPGKEPVIGTRGRVVTFHDLRHTYATHQIAAGTDVRTVASLMGHADPAVTMRRYAAALAAAREAAQAKAAPVLAKGTRYALQAV